MLAAFIAIIMGSLGVCYPSFSYKSELLTPQQIERNQRIGGFVLLAMRLFWK
jgi:hypothetical protein